MIGVLIALAVLAVVLLLIYAAVYELGGVSYRNYRAANRNPRPGTLEFRPTVDTQETRKRIGL